MPTFAAYEEQGPTAYLNWRELRTTENAVCANNVCGDGFNVKGRIYSARYDRRYAFHDAGDARNESVLFADSTDGTKLLPVHCKTYNGALKQTGSKYDPGQLKTAEVYLFAKS